MTRRDLEQRLANTTWSRPPDHVPMGKCWCGGAYMDTEIGADSHEVVMGHRPAQKKAPQPGKGEAPARGDPTTDPGRNDHDDERE